MQELLRIRHAFTTAGKGHALRDYNLLLFTGEIFYLQGISGSGKSNVIRVLLGETPLETGELIFGGEKIETRLQREQLQRKICYLDFSDQIVDSLSVMENLLVLHRNHSPLQTFSRSELIKKAQPLLDQAGIHAKAGHSARRLSFLDKQKLCILKAQLAGMSLVILDCARRDELFPDLDELGKYMETLAAQGMTFLVVSERPNRIIEIADRFQIIHGGMDVRQWASEPDNRERLTNYVSTPIPRLGQRADEQNAAMVVGITDFRWSPEASSRTLLSVLREKAPEIWREYFGFSIPPEDSYIHDRVAWVTWDSGQGLFPEMDIGDNLLLTLAHRAGIASVIPRGMKEFLLKEFQKRLELPPTITQIEQLTETGRKILSIYRLSLTRPQVMVLEAPLAGLDIRETGKLLEYLDELRSTGVRLIILSQHLEPCLPLCDAVLTWTNSRQPKLHRLRQSNS